MRTCTAHSHDLLNAIEKKGLRHLVRPERAAAAAQEWLRGKGEVTDKTFDPYVGSVMEIQGKAVDLGAVDQYRDPIDTCALCRINAHTKNPMMATSWIDNVTDLMLAVALKNGIARPRATSIVVPVS